MPKLLKTVLVLNAIALVGCSTTPSPEVRTAVAAPPPIASAPANAPSVWPVDAPQIVAQSAILIDAASGKVLFQKNADVQRPVASTQKLLTALLVARRGNLDELVTIQSPETAVEPTKLGLKVGERYPRRKLLESIMVKSANDACATLARDHSGTESSFADQMNATAWALGARSSHFVNSHGLPAGQYSTARDIARVAFHAYRHPELREMSSSASRSSATAADVSRS
jgi:D-alanyl-D-alanine carboxypeptidase (penicillin-binding protein 5/6)